MPSARTRSWCCRSGVRPVDEVRSCKPRQLVQSNFRSSLRAGRRRSASPSFRRSMAFAFRADEHAPRRAKPRRRRPLGAPRVHWQPSCPAACRPRR
jgi:hypothetical protein